LFSKGYREYVLLSGDNGQLNWISNYKDGKQEGEQLYYWKDGQFWFSDIYKDGKLIKTITP